MMMPGRSGNSPCKRALDKLETLYLGGVEIEEEGVHSFIPGISIAPLQVLYYSEALPTSARIMYRSFMPKRTGNCR